MQAHPSVPHYSRLNKQLLQTMTPATSETIFEKDVIPYLIDAWIDNYGKSASTDDIVETSVLNFSYLFDIARERLISAWGISRGRHGGARDKSRMAGHPLSAGTGYHRGHAIPHTLGGPTDINLVAQLGSVNVGPFRELERKAVATPGALYFTYWMYGPDSVQKPAWVQQGLLRPECPPEFRTHGN